MATPGKKTAGPVSPAGRKFTAAARAIRVRASGRPRVKKGKEPLTLWDKLDLWAGTCKGLPSDLARNHDHYLHGTPRR